MLNRSVPSMIRIVPFSVLASGCTEPSPFALTKTDSGLLAIVTRRCEPIRIEGFRFGHHGKNKIPGDSDDEIMFSASSQRRVRVTRLVLDEQGLSQLVLHGVLSDVMNEENKPLYVDVKLFDRNISYVVGFRSTSLRDSLVRGDRVKPFEAKEYCQ